MDFDDSEAMRSNLLVSLFKQAIKTFAPINVSGIEFLSNFKDLKGLLDKVRAVDVRLDPSFNDISLWESKEKAPCTYIEIFQNQNVNMSIFVLRPGFTMPLHDHPQMHGLLKVISGTVRVRSFSKIQNENDLSNDKLFLAKMQNDISCNAESESCVLTPEDSNYHEIEAVGGPSAFLDILAPPYSTYIREREERQCRYYNISQEINDRIVQLQEIPPPGWFYCDQAPYLGPVLT